MIDIALLRSRSRPTVALGLDLRSPRMELTRITHHQGAKHSSSLVSKTQTPSSAKQICSLQRSPDWQVLLSKRAGCPPCPNSHHH